MDFRPAIAAETREQTVVLAGQYEVGSLLGCGAMSNVYRARDRRTRHELAVKTFLPGPEFVRVHRNWQRQLAIASTLRHPGLVSLLDAHPADDTADPPFLILELVTGPTLDRYLRDGALTEVQVAYLGSALCEALSYLHARRVVHRAIKPTNVLLATPQNPLDLQPKLTDFGLGLIVDSARMTKLATISAANYFSPEQVSGAPVGPASDMYALGLVLIEALTGELVFTGYGVEMARVRLDRDPVIPTGISPAFADLLSRMTTRDAGSRPSAAAAGADLAAVVAASADSDPLAMEQYATAYSARGPQHEASRARKRLGALVVAGVSVVVLAASDGLGSDSNVIGPDSAPLAAAAPSGLGAVAAAGDGSGAAATPSGSARTDIATPVNSGRRARAGASKVHGTPPSSKGGHASRSSNATRGGATARAASRVRAVAAREAAAHGGVTRTTATKSGSTKSGATKSGATNSGSTKSGSTKSGPTTSGATHSGATKSAAAKAAAARAARAAAANDAAAKAANRAAARRAANRAAADQAAADKAAATKRAAAQRAAAARQAAAEKAAADARRARRAAAQKPLAAHAIRRGPAACSRSCSRFCAGCSRRAAASLPG